jgi:hypothetical protein
MYLRSRYHRQGFSSVQERRTTPAWIRFFLFSGALLIACYILWTVTIHLLGGAGTLERTGSTLTVEERGTVTVTIDERSQRAQDGMQLFPGESVMTGPGAHAMLQMFDGTTLRMDGGAEMTIENSARGDDQSIVELIINGGAWLSVPSSRAFSGSIVRTVRTPHLLLSLEPGTETLVRPDAVWVYATEGAGVSVTLKDGRTFLVSEGQKWSIPTSGSVGENVYATREAIAGKPDDPFSIASREMLAANTKASFSSRISGDALLTVTTPAEGATFIGPLLTVRGSASSVVASVRVNGRSTLLDPATGSFAQDLVPPDDGKDIDVAIQALAHDGTVLAEIHRLVIRAPQTPPAPPSVTLPAKTGQTYYTDEVELVIRGKSPARATAIYVNDYKLQLFTPAKGEWSYVASLKLKNMIPGSNTYDVVAEDAQGRRSEAARLTIVQGQGNIGAVASSLQSSTSTVPLSDNAPLLPGSLSVTGPTPGTSHVETGTGFLLEGKTSTKTAAVYVNDYKLQLYTAGKDFWNYIASTEYQNFKKGTNTYVIVARDAAGKILDKMTYTVTGE